MPKPERVQIVLHAHEQEGIAAIVVDGAGLQTAQDAQLGGGEAGIDSQRHQAEDKPREEPDGERTSGFQIVHHQGSGNRTPLPIVDSYYCPAGGPAGSISSMVPRSISFDPTNTGRRGFGLPMYRPHNWFVRMSTMSAIDTTVRPN